MTGLLGIRLPRTQPVAMFDHQVQKQIGIDRIVLGPTGVEGFAEAGQAFGVHGVGHDMFVLQQSRQECSPGLLQANGSWVQV